VAFANRYWAPHARLMERLYLDLLTDEIEQQDHVLGLYRKSLLYLIANALEADPATPILGLARVFHADAQGWDGSPDTAEALANWRQAAVSAGASPCTATAPSPPASPRKRVPRPVTAALTTTSG
jgi:hypothetical protein